jgi:hypothetical protein
LASAPRSEPDPLVAGSSPLVRDLGRGRDRADRGFLTDQRPQSFAVAGVEGFWGRFDPAADRRRSLYEGLAETDLQRSFDYLGVYRSTVAQLVRTHAAHFTGHTWQIRYVRGTYSRAFGTDKRVFDPF